MIVIGIILIACQMIAGWANSVMDTLAHHYPTSKFSKKKNQQWWNPKISWKNKYKHNDPKQGAKFFGSTTFLVFLTDAWHFYKWIMLGVLPIPGAVFIGFLFLDWKLILLSYVILRATFAVIFHLFYNLIYPKY